MENTLIIGDTHEPVSRKGYLAFCQDMAYRWDCKEFVHVGDVVDWHAVSFWSHHPECPGPTDEYELAYEKVQRWYKAFPKMKVCIGNHDERLIRLGQSVNIPAKFIRNYQECWDTPGWDWQYQHIKDDVCFIHGTGYGGKYHAANIRDKSLMSVVAGHVHTAFSINWTANPTRRVFGMNVGCGIDDEQMQFAYGKHMKQRSMLGCGVIVDNMPYLEPMPCGKGEAYHDSRF